MRTRKTDITPIQREFLDWYLDPNRQGTQNEWARQHGLASSTISSWKQRDPFFQAALNEGLAERNLDPENLASIVSAMSKKAQEGDVQAAKFVWDYLKTVDPSFGKPDAERPLHDYSDEEIEEALREAARLSAARTDDADDGSAAPSAAPTTTPEAHPSSDPTDGGTEARPA